MATSDRPKRAGLIGMLLGAAALVFVLGGCDAATKPSTGAGASAPPLASAAPAASTAPSTVATPTQAPTPAPTPPPTATPAPTPAPAVTAAPAPTPTPPPSAAPATVIDDYAWVYEKRPLSLSGTAGTTTWTKVLFGAQTVALKWTATPASSAGCAFKYRIEAKTLPKAVAAAQKVKGAKAGSGSRTVATKYGDGVVTVTTDCAKYTLRMTSASHPGLTIKQSTDPYKVTGTTATELNEGLAKASADWSFRMSTKYYKGGTIRVSSFTVMVPIQYELPKWTPPEGTDQALIDSWRTAIKGMRTHVEGEAAIGIQAAGRFINSSTKKTFGSVGAMTKYRDKGSDKWIDVASDKTETYNADTEWGYTQGAYIQ